MGEGAKKVQVLQNDIDRAIRQDSSHCVVATAVARAFPDAVRISVDTQLIRFTHAVTGKRVGYLTPLKVQAYVVAFDAGDPIPPFSFTLGSPVPMRQRTLTDEGKRRQLASHDKRNGKPRKPRKAREVDVTGSVEEKVLVHTPLKTDTSEPDAWTPPPLVFKRRSRQYGMRVLRANQAKGINDQKVRPLLE